MHSHPGFPWVWLGSSGNYPEAPPVFQQKRTSSSSAFLVGPLGPEPLHGVQPRSGPGGPSVPAPHLRDGARRRLQALRPSGAADGIRPVRGLQPRLRLGGGEGAFQRGAQPLKERDNGPKLTCLRVARFGLKAFLARLFMRCTNVVFSSQVPVVLTVEPHVPQPPNEQLATVVIIAVGSPNSQVRPGVQRLVAPLQRGI